MGVREKWEKRFMKSLRGDEKRAFQLWSDFSKKKISEDEFKAKMDMDEMPRVLGKMNAVRLDTLEQEIDNLDKRVRILEKKISS
jgi:polyhydroxyalkanoate synthesis regulator phasin